MIGFWIIAALLLTAAVLLLYFPWSGHGAPERDALNMAFYHARLQELKQENPADAGVMEVELQRTLLADIPDTPCQNARPLSRWVLLPGALVLVALSVGMFIKTSRLSEVQAWQTAQHNFPALMHRMMETNAQPLSVNEIAQLGLGLRTQLQSTPDDVDGWRMLGRIGIVLHHPETAINAFARAHRLAPDNPEVTLDYARVLLQSNNERAIREGELILRDRLQHQPDDLNALELLAFSAWYQQRYADALNVWQKMLTLLPENDARRDSVQRLLNEVRTRIQTEKNALPGNSTSPHRAN